MPQQRTTKAIEALRTYCKDHGQRATPPREHVLDIVASADHPLTAYDVLNKLSKKLNQPKPPTAYRALEFLMQHGFIHRIESLNSYVACGEDHKHRGSQFMICDTCGQVEEVHLCHIPDGLQKQVNQKGFNVSYWNAELHGLCRKCN